MARSACRCVTVISCTASSRNIRPGYCASRKHFSKCSLRNSNGESDEAAHGESKMSEHIVSDHQPGLVERTFDTDEVRLNYAEGPANGPPLVLIHGLGRRWQVFLPIIPALSLRWHIFAPDLRGHGKSSHVARGYHGPQYSG